MSCIVRNIDKCSAENSRSRLAPNERNQLTTRGTSLGYTNMLFLVLIANLLYCIKHVLYKDVYVVGVAN